MAWPAVNQHYTQETFRQRVQSLQWTRWRPRGITLHNTAAPNIAQWKDTAENDARAGRVPGITRMHSLEDFFRNQRKWSGCPHLFVAPPIGDRGGFIWEANVLTAPGVHSPSWNTTHIGIEMVADFARDDDDSGPGLVVRNNSIFATAILCSTLGLDPFNDVVLHKEDPRTDHDCPGIDFARDRKDVIAAIAALMDGGDHDPGEDNKTEPSTVRKGVVMVNDLNVRVGPGAGNRAVVSLWKGAQIVVLDEAKNGTTSWLRIETPAGYAGEPHGFWVAARYVDVQT